MGWDGWVGADLQAVHFVRGWGADLQAEHEGEDEVALKSGGLGVEHDAALCITVWLAKPRHQKRLVAKPTTRPYLSAAATAAAATTTSSVARQARVRLPPVVPLVIILLCVCVCVCV